ncbi:hypothetical protein L6164_025386 [Bauhinia variegata]|uniref:Uncharacterized protein n=1 Tax=Bauhinia variegata TaxID=167791 RepID=A0ACB9M231_BAUVA|nr:hypothetical protein L6164_025386 [Bauhinia variegata]
MKEVTVVIVGAGPSGLATSACLKQNSISHIVLEREDCNASLWRKNAYDRVYLHLAKEFCSLPYMSHPPSAPTFLSKEAFLWYIDEYVARFNINPRYGCCVESAVLCEGEEKWRVEVNNSLLNRREVYEAKFLVVATGENSHAYIPQVPGLDSFEGEIVHSKNYKSGSKYKSKEVLVVGCGNSGMEIAYDLTEWGVNPSILIRSPFHVLNKELVRRGMSMLASNSTFETVDALVLSMAETQYGDLTQYGIYPPKGGPFYLKDLTGRSPVVDVGTIQRIKDGSVKVIRGQIERIENKKVVFENTMEKEFDVIVFATGYRSVANEWLKDYKYVLNVDGWPKNAFPRHWKGERGLYCAGLSKRGLFGVARDAEAIANDINQILNGNVGDTVPAKDDKA